MRLAPKKRQTMLFSATMTEEVKSLAALSLQHPVRLAANVKAAAPKLLRQEIIRMKVGILHTTLPQRICVCSFQVWSISFLVKGRRHAEIPFLLMFTSKCLRSGSQCRECQVSNLSMQSQAPLCQQMACNISIVSTPRFAGQGQGGKGGATHSHLCTRLPGWADHHLFLHQEAGPQSKDAVRPGTAACCRGAAWGHDPDGAPGIP